MQFGSCQCIHEQAFNCFSGCSLDRTQFFAGWIWRSLSDFHKKEICRREISSFFNRVQETTEWIFVRRDYCAHSGVGIDHKFPTGQHNIDCSRWRNIPPPIQSGHIQALWWVGHCEGQSCFAGVNHQDGRIWKGRTFYSRVFQEVPLIDIRPTCEERCPLELPRFQETRQFNTFERKSGHPFSIKTSVGSLWIFWKFNFRCLSPCFPSPPHVIPIE